MAKNIGSATSSLVTNVPYQGTPAGSVKIPACPMAWTVNTMRKPSARSESTSGKRGLPGGGATASGARAEPASISSGAAHTT